MLTETLRRMAGFDDQTLRRWDSLRAEKGQQVLLRVGQLGGHVGKLAFERGDAPVELLAASGWAKIVWMAAITMWVLSRVTLASTLRMKWTRQRCQGDPTTTASMAFFRPKCCSKMF
jgi:hypothetical protein